MNYNKVRF